MTVDFAISCSLVRPGRPRYPVFVHRAAALLHAFFRPHLATTPLRFANPSPPLGWIEDFHLQAVVHTRHTIREAAFCGGLISTAICRRYLPSVALQLRCNLLIYIVCVPKTLNPTVVVMKSAKDGE
jgi:hypothetical protein